MISQIMKLPAHRAGLGGLAGQMDEKGTEGSRRSIVIKVIGAGVFLPF
jgi:hypothetical protein